MCILHCLNFQCSTVDAVAAFSAGVIVSFRPSQAVFNLAHILYETLALENFAPNRTLKTLSLVGPIASVDTNFLRFADDD